MLVASRAICACAAIAAVITGCAATGASTVTASGKGLTIYVSAAGGSQAAQDVLAAEQLAFQGTSGVAGYTIKLVTARGKPSDNARAAIQDTTSIAYLGEIEPGDSAGSLGITNALDLLQVSPTDTAIALTQKSGAVSGSPENYYQALKTYGRTFARMVPNGAVEAKAQVLEMQALGVKKLYVSDDGSAYGKEMAQSVRNAVPSGITVASTQAGADGFFYGGVSPSSATRAFASSGATARLFAPSALDSATFAAGLPPSEQSRLYISAPGFLPKDLTPAAKKFVSDFTNTYHRAPAAEAIFGYEAMKAVLAVLSEAGSSANNRSTVVRDFFAIKNRDSVLGTYSISAAGDTSLRSIVFSRPRGGKLTPFKSVSVPG
jgi:branched-chain amino acid transport system substrate-binding protein